MGTNPQFLFRSMLSELLRGQPIGVRQLQAHGLSAKHASRLAQAGWLQRLGRGVYLLPGDALDRLGSLAQLAQDIPGLHVAGKTALAWWGVRHNLAARELLSLWGDAPARLPAWFTERFPAHYQASHLFDSALPPTLGLAVLPDGRPDVLVSTPERALLELLSEVGKRQGLEEASHLLESARTVRLPVLDELLAHLTRIKVARLAAALSHELDLPWQAMARHHSERLGGGERWVTRGRTGERLNLKRSP